MDYMKELNAFRNWQLLNPISTGEVALWHTLMSLNNMTGWKEWFVVPNSTVQLLTGMSKQGVDNARNKLIQRRLIEYQKGGKNEAGRYKMLPVSELVNFQTQKLDQLVDQFIDDQLTSSLTSSGTDACPLIDIDNTKTINTTSATTDARASEEVSVDAKVVFKAFEEEGFGTLTSLLVDELNDAIDTYTAQWVIKAMKEAAKMNKRYLAYVLGILKRWKAEGIDSPWERSDGEDAKSRASPARSDGVDYNRFSI